ncbi:hypothetical protein ABIB40_000499 [Pedobacter sp. UYP30]|uniref:hypothetical protein n=1 Tax=Pedobacter sp. UYP30 TaxID=1756400 RepID=UPI003391C7AD
MENEIIIKTEQQYEANMIALFELQEKEELTSADKILIAQMIKAGDKYEAENL